MQQISERLIRSYVLSPERRHALYRRTLVVVIFSQIFGGAGLAAGVTVGALLAQQMLGTAGLAGLPSALFTLGSAGAALLVGRISQRRGRRVGLSAGFIAGGIGAAGVVLAAVTNNVILLFIALLVYGSGTATNLQARYAGTDLAPARRRATAVSMAMVSTTLGAVAGPNLVTPMGVLAANLGIPALAGPFLLAAAAYTLAGIVLFFWLRPDPLLLATAITNQDQTAAVAPDVQSRPEPSVNSRGVTVGTTVMVLTQVAMVAIMTMTPVHMQSHGHGLTEVGIVIGIHIGFMYLPSLVTGMLVDKLGRVPMAIAAGLTLLAAGIVAATAPAQSMMQLMIALALLGLGWNFGLISGTALIVDATPLETRAKTQGSIDVLIALAGATGGALSGVVVAGSSYAILSLAGGILSLMLIPVLIWSQRTGAAPTG
ncbi:MFS transporter [Arthrobacter sp. MMS18-M83]|uniref:MFS transporter n=1 Tax=Arthrobacter sp. MMS18-M83 TaxID=2996261 RepID=UPI00227BF934|nr:MFS transporter [Arthrobacter sp. MMS18-M83]WAH97279.1 MFS transporter [Arthrobacter sp. MMS18-M83]